MPFTNKHSVSLDSFDGGMNTKINTANVPLTQSPDMLNFELTDYGAISVRKGHTKYNSASIGSHPIEGVFSYKPATMSAQLLLFAADKIMIATGTATVLNSINSAVSVFTSGANLDIVQFQDLAIFSNGNVQPYKFNGNEFTRLGVSAPTQSLTAACDAAAGNLNGTYTYVYTGVGSYLAEGDYGGVSTARAVVSASVRVNNIPTAPASHGINTWNIYRNTANGAGVYWKVTAVTNGVTSFTDNVADSSLTVAAPTDQGYPRLFKFMVYYQGRLWGAGDSNKDYLWYSNINQPEEFPSTNFIRVGKGDGLDISGLAVLSGSVVITKSDQNGRTAVYLLFVGDTAASSDPTNWNLIKTDSPQGADSHNCLVNYSNALLMLNRTGVYSFTGRDLNLNQSETSKGALMADAASFDIEPDIQALPTAYLNKATAIDYKNRVWISCTDAAQTKNNAMFVFDYVRASDSDRRQGAWTKFDELRITRMCIHEGVLVGGGSGHGGGATEGYAYNLDTGFSDNGSTISAHFVTASIKGNRGHEGYIKDWRWAYITVDVNAVDELNVRYATDFSDFSGITAFGLAATATESVRVIKYPITRGISGDDPAQTVQNYGRMIQLKLSTTSGNTSTARVTIRKIEMFYTLRGLR